MSNYPAFFQLRDGTTTRESGHELVRATNGAARMRRLYAAEKSSFEIGHVLSSTERDQLEAFYQAEKDNAVTFKHSESGATYQVLFMGAPQFKRRGQKFEVRVRLEEV